MGCIRPATPGFLLTLLAAALLAVVSFCVPYFRSVFFLKADVSSNGVSGTITFGTLGYCLTFNGVTTCSKPSIGYELDINSLVGNKFPVEIPDAVVKWITYVLVLHIVALVLAVGAAIFGLLAHVREMAMTCCSTLLSGLAAAAALLAFIFDLALFFLAKARINAVGKASMGNAIWLTLAAWILLFFSGCFYTLGRCCISNRKRGDWDTRKEPPPPGTATEQMRLDAVKAEADRKAHQKATEGGLPAFHESQPLTSSAYDDGSNIYSDKPQTPGGYMQAPVGSRAVDQYYNNDARSGAGYGNNAYPPRNQYTPSTYNNYNAPQPQRQPSAYADQQNAYPAQQNAYSNQQNAYSNQQNAYSNQQNAYPGQNAYSTQQNAYQQNAYPAQQNTYPPQQYHSTPPLPQVAVAPLPQQHHSTPSPQQTPQQTYGEQSNTYLDPNAANPYGHTGHPSRGTSYHSAATHAGEYSQYDPYDAGATHSGSDYATPQTQFPQSQYTPEKQYSQSRDYNPRGDGYGVNSVPPLETDHGYFPQTAMHEYTEEPHSSGSKSPPMPPKSPTSPKGPRGHRQSLQVVNHGDDEPPQYDPTGSEHFPGAWGKH